MHTLICKGAKFSYFLLLLFALPIITEAPLILKLWLGNVPEYTVVFVRLAIVSSMVNILGNTPYTACMATGNIKKYAIWVTGIGSLAFFLTIPAYKLGLPPETSYWIYVVVYTFILFVKLLLMRQMLSLSISKYVYSVLCRIIPVTIITFVLMAIFTSIIETSITRGILTCLLSLLVWTASVYVIGLTNSERDLVTNKLKTIL